MSNARKPERGEPQLCMPPVDVQTPEQYHAWQRHWAPEVVRRDDFGAVRLVAGVDAAYAPDDLSVRAAAAVLSWPALDLVEHAVVTRSVPAPYQPGMFSWREVPAILEALAALSAVPDLLFCDGHGVAHPRRFGIACHLGIAAGIPSIGVGKNLLVGAFATLGAERGSRSPLIDRGETVGAALRTRAEVKPIYVSCGHRVGLDTAIHYVLGCAPRYRQPEPIRAAHHRAGRIRG